MDQLYYHIGKALVRWQNVEDAHFGLFFELLGAPNYELAAVAYYSVENFALRNAMIDRLIQLTLVGRNCKNQRRDWCSDKGGLCSEIVGANKARNKLAHYNAEIIHDRTERSEDGILQVFLSGPTLRPSAYNVVSRLLGETPSNPKFNLTIDNIRAYADQFKNLAEKISAFRGSLPPPPETNPEQSAGLPPKYLLQYGPSRRSTPRRDDEPRDV